MLQVFLCKTCRLKIQLKEKQVKYIKLIAMLLFKKQNLYPHVAELLENSTTTKLWMQTFSVK